MSQLNEPPYEILKRTSCRVGEHAWIWAGVGTGPSEPAPEMLCTCGTFRWDEWKQNHEEVKR